MNTQRLTTAILNLLKRKGRPMSIADIHVHLGEGRYAIEACLRRLEERKQVSPGPPAPARTWVAVTPRA